MRTPVLRKIRTRLVGAGVLLPLLLLFVFSCTSAPQWETVQDKQPTSSRIPEAGQAYVASLALEGETVHLKFQNGTDETVPFKLLGVSLPKSSYAKQPAVYEEIPAKGAPCLEDWVKERDRWIADHIKHKTVYARTITDFDGGKDEIQGGVYLYNSKGEAEEGKLSLNARLLKEGHATYEITADAHHSEALDRLQEEARSRGRGLHSCRTQHLSKKHLREWKRRMSQQERRRMFRKRKKEIRENLNSGKFGDAYSRAETLKNALSGTELARKGKQFYKYVKKQVEKSFEERLKTGKKYIDEGKLHKALQFFKEKKGSFNGSDRLVKKFENQIRKLEDMFSGGKNDIKETVARSNVERSRVNDDDIRKENRKSGGNARADAVKSTSEDAGHAANEQRKDQEDVAGNGETKIFARGPSMNNYPGSPKQVDIEKVASNENSAHFQIDFRGHASREKCGWFMFRLDNAAKKHVRIDLQNIGRYEIWKTLNPVYAQIPNLSDPKFYISQKSINPERTVKAKNGPTLPNTSKQYWKFIEDVETDESSSTLTLREKFTEDRAYVAMRVPYTTELHENYMDILRKKNGVNVHTVGLSEEGDPLHVLQIGHSSKRKARSNPTVVLYAREHADEMDTSWVTMGALEFLLSGERLARRIRSNTTFIIIPLLDPAGSKRCQYENITYTFDRTGERSNVSNAMAEWFREWVDEGGWVDLALDLHNVESNEGPHLFCYRMEPKNLRYEAAQKLHRNLINQMGNNGYNVRESVHDLGVMYNLLGGFLFRFFRTQHAVYEFNSQAPERHLSLRELKAMGKLVAISCASFLNSGSQEVNELLRTIQIRRRQRKILMDRYGFYIQEKEKIKTPIDVEEFLWAMPRFEKRYLKKREEGTLENEHHRSLLEEIYNQPGVSPENLPSF